MAKIKVDKQSVVREISPEAQSAREVRWESFVANYKKTNPVKGLAKEANGEFKTIPASFV